MAATSDNPHEARPEQSRPQLTWKLPEGWKEKAPGDMAALKLMVPGKGGEEAEVSAMQFPAKGLPMVDLVNVVRQDAGLPAITEEELNRDTETVAVGSDKGSLIDLNRAMASSATNARVMLAVYPHGASTWFLKFAGDPAVVTSQKPAFLEFLKSLSITEGNAATSDPHQGMAMQPGINPSSPSGAALASAGATAEQFNWKVPPDWKPSAHNEMQVALFSVPGKADVSVSVFPGDTGGTLANVNRWRRKIGLPPATDENLPSLVSSLDPADSQAILVDMTNNGQQLIGAIVPRDGKYWFYKLQGDAGAVAPEKDAFIAFAKSKP